MANRKYTPEHINFIRDNIKGTSFKDLTSMFNKQFEMSLKVSTMVSLADRHGLHNGIDARFNEGWEPTQFKKGHEPWNKGKKGLACGGKETQFKKGHKPWNYQPVGAERVNSYGYVDIKVADPNKWKGKHILLWEEARGPVPEGHVVIFGDGDKQNFDLANLILVSRAQLARLNQNNLIQNDTGLTKTGIIIADIQLKIGERKKKAK